MWENPSRGAPHRLRKQTLQRDNNQCVNCGSTERLEVDHIINVARGGTHNLNNLQTLCHHCHKTKTAKESAHARQQRTQRAKMAIQPHPGLLAN